MDAPAQKVLYDNEARLNEVARDFRSVRTAALDSNIAKEAYRTPSLFPQSTCSLPWLKRREVMTLMRKTKRRKSSRRGWPSSQARRQDSFVSVGQWYALIDQLKTELKAGQTNQVALRTHLVQPPHAVIMDHRAHIHINEAGGLAYHSQATSVTLVPSNGRYLRWEEDIKPVVVIGDDNIHLVPTKVIELENTLSGTIFPQEEVEKISREARKLGSE